MTARYFEVREVAEGWEVYTDGKESWYRKGTITVTGDGTFVAKFRGRYDAGTHATLDLAVEAIRDAGRREAEALRGQIAYERAHGWSTD